METAVRSVGPLFLVIFLLGLLAAVAWFAWAGIAGPGEPMPTEGYVALVFGAFIAVLVGVGLMALLFYSSRRGTTSHRILGRIAEVALWTIPTKIPCCALSKTRGAFSENTSNRVRDSTKTVEGLLAVLDRNDLVHALDRINRRMALRLVEGSLVKNKAPPPWSGCTET
jgi:hypothetical protein